MPKDLKKRGRRFEKQKQQEDAQKERPSKRRRIQDADSVFGVEGNAGDDFISFGNDHGTDEQDDQQTTFYGLLTEEEQQYYTTVNNKISAHDFEDEADRTNFIEAVYRETAGKEIKVASSQSCSRHLEKIMQMSTASQLRSLFLAFVQDLGYLVQHRFGSHCVETLFLESAKHVDAKTSSHKDEPTSFEALFLTAEEKLRANSGFLMTERFASHTIRVLLLILSGQALEDATTNNIVASRKKEKIEVSDMANPRSSEARKVPSSFKAASKAFVESAISALDTTYLRALATSPTGSPVLQLLLQLELLDTNTTSGTSSSVLLKVVPDQQFEADSESSKFLSALIYDASGAYLVQTLVRSLPGKSFKKMYRNLFRDRIGKLAKNEIASYVAMSIFERVGKDDLAHAVDSVIPELPGLVERNRLAIVRSLIERGAARGVDLHALQEALVQTYGDQILLVLPKMLKLNFSTESDGRGEAKAPQGLTSVDLQGSLLAQSMLKTDLLSPMIQDSLCAQTDASLLDMSKNPVASRVVQAALTAEVSSQKFLRQFVPRFYGMVAELAIDASGSHVVDALWVATKGSHFMKERIAVNLQNNERKLRDSTYGRTLWKNWSMDLYQRRPSEWQAIAKGRNLESATSQAEDAGPKKTPIEMARRRHMQQQARRVSSNNAVKASA